MSTAYLDRAKLEGLLGVKTVADALGATSASLDAIMAAQSAIADGYASAQVALPLSSVAIEQVAPIVAELVFCALNARGASDVIAARRTAAMKALSDIAKRVTLLHRDPVADNPATVEDESADGAACGAAPRQTLRRRLSEGFDARW